MSERGYCIKIGRCSEGFKLKEKFKAVVMITTTVVSVGISDGKVWLFNTVFVSRY